MATRISPSEYNELVQRLGEKAGEFHDLMRDHRLRDKLDFSSLIREPLRELPQASGMHLRSYPAPRSTYNTAGRVHFTSCSIPYLDPTISGILASDPGKCTVIF
jgi:hypothetical protein